MYTGVGSPTFAQPRCAPPDVKRLAAEICRTQVKGLGALPGEWAGIDPCFVKTLPDCIQGFVGPFDMDGGGDEGGGGSGDDDGDRGAVVIGGILLLLLAGGGSYYMYRRYKRKAS